MALYRAWAKAAGYLIVMDKGAALERLLNLASANGIYLWDIKRYPPDVMVLRVGIHGFRALRPLLRRTNCRARIKRRHGWPFLWHRLTRRAGFLCGFILFLALLAFLTSFVWRIELLGIKSISPDALRRNLRRLGLYEGVFRGGLDKDRIQQELEILTPQAAWISIELRGIVALVRVVERTGPPAKKQSADLVAARDGLIVKVVVYQGTPVAAEGEMVRAGQLLVSGTEVSAGPDGTLLSRQVTASGRIEARVWDEARAYMPLVIWQSVATGRRTRVIRLRLGARTFSFPRERPPYIWFQQIRTQYGLWHGRNTLPLVELIIDRYDEVRPA